MSEWPFKERAAVVAMIHVGAVVVTGSATGEPPRASDVSEAKTRCRLPVVVGSGVTPENVSEFYAAADALVVGSFFKRDGLWSNPVERARVERLTDAVRNLRARA
ncbi:MAG: hypothetical protein LC795_13975 [Acidobacteria bacterium]|nr:hypothetical protein [Acidobacteriota bacterium]MCA1620387.1 hypothetical protein [Acidobacteriota bacterium]